MLFFEFLLSHRSNSNAAVASCTAADRRVEPVDGVALGPCRRPARRSFVPATLAHALHGRLSPAKNTAAAAGAAADAGRGVAVALRILPQLA